MTKQEFNEEEFRQRLIDGGIPASDAAEVAAKTAAGKAQELSPALTSLPLFPVSAPVEKASKRGTRLAAKTPIRAKPKKVIARTAPRLTDAEATELKDTANKHREQYQQKSLFDIAPWDDDMRALPNDLAGSALFTNRNKSVKREARENYPIFSYNSNVRITYTGVELRAANDELVLLQVLEYAKHQQPGEPITFTFYELCADLDWPINGKYYKAAEQALMRLQATALQFISDKVGLLESLSLIHRFRVLDRGTRKARCEVRIDPEMVLLFGNSRYSKFVWEKYRKLSPTARRLFDFFAGHKTPYPLKLETFRLMCGSDSQRERKWKEQSEAACFELRDNGMVANAWIAGGMIHALR